MRKRVALIMLGAVCRLALPADAEALLRLSEVMTSDNTAFPDEDGDYGDWVELVNAGHSDAPLEGWGLTDDPVDQPLKWTFPALTLRAGERLVVWASGKDRRPPRKVSDGPFVVAPSNTVWKYRDNGLAPDANWTATNYNDLAWASGMAMLGYGFAKVTTTVSYGGNSGAKYPTTYFRQTFVSPVGFGEARSNGVLRLWVDDGAIFYLNGVDILHVRMATNGVTHLSTANTTVNGNGQWEAYEVPVWALKKGTNVLAAEVHQVSAGSSDIALWAELSVRPTPQHANFKISAGSETVTLSDPAGLPVDVAPALSVLRDASFGRVDGQPDGPWLMFPFPTPGTNNSEVGYSGLLEPPAFTVPSGFYASPVTVAITNADPTASIYYTLDGSTPTNAVTTNCFLYTAPLALADRTSLSNRLSLIRTNPVEMTNNTQYGWVPPSGQVPKVSVVRAMAYRSGYFSPRGAAGTWLIGSVPLQHTLKVVSLMSDEANLFGDPLGLFVPGDIYKALGWNGHYVGLPNANYFQRGDTWERPLFVQLFEADRTLALSQLMGVRNHGAWSRGAAQKSLLLYAREEYGDSAAKYTFFPGQTDKTFKRLLLHNSGNDWSSTGFRDAMTQAIFRPYARCDTQDYEPAVTYVNGEYWGYENFREHYSKYYFERHYGVDPDTLDFLKATVSSEAMEIEEGDDLDYKEVLAFCKTNDLSIASNYAWVESRMDFDSLIDHYACEFYCGNTDWPGNNLAVWRVRTAYNPSAPRGHDGRWRWTIYDTDSGFSNASQDMMYQARRSSRGVCQPQFNRLLANIDFRNRFVNRYADLSNTAFQPGRVASVISNMAARIDAEIPRHVARWGRMVSYAAWLSRVSAMKAFAANRPAYAFTNIVNEFGFGGMARLTVDLTNGAGRITVNTVTIDGSTLGLANPAKPFPWIGAYFKTVPVTVSVTPDPGFAFARWESSAGVLPDQTLTLTVTNDVSLRAVLEPALLPRATVNEVMADATKAGGQLHPTTGSAEDWFELLNESPAAVDLSGCWLVDSQPDNACQIPAGVVLQPGACLRVWTGSSLAAGRNADGSLNATFGLGKSGDAVALQTSDRNSDLDRVTFGAQTSNVSQGRWPNGAAGAWVGFAKPTPALPNRSPTAAATLLPLYAVQSVAVTQTLALAFAPTATVSQAVYMIAEGPADAAINAAGGFSWTPSVSLASGLYAFRIALMGLTNGVAVTDETTLLVAVSNTRRFVIEALSDPPEGGAVTGGGAYVDGESVTLTAVAQELWRFTRWSDGLTSVSRAFPAKRDATYTASFAYGLIAPDVACGTLEGGKPLLYWSAVPGAKGYAVRRAASQAGPFGVVGVVTNNVFLDASPLIGVDAYYTVAALHDATEGPPSLSFQAFASGVTRKLTGSVIGSLSSYNNDLTRTRDKVFDGDLATFYDAAADGGWPGQEYDGDRWRRLAYLRYSPRAGQAGRMVNGKFQIASISDTTTTFESPETLHTITATPAVGVYTPVTLDLDRRFRFLRYLPPTGGWGNIAELEAYGYDSVPATPASLSPTSGVRSVSLAWPAVANASGFLVQRAEAAGGPFATVAYVQTPAFTQAGLTDGTNLYVRVAAVNGNGVSAYTLAQAVSAATPAVIPSFAAASGAGVGASGGEVTLRLSGALDPRLALVCSDRLDRPVAEWSEVPGASISAPDPVSGAVTVSLQTNAPTLFFAVRLK